MRYTLPGYEVSFSTRYLSKPWVTTCILFNKATHKTTVASVVKHAKDKHDILLAEKFAFEKAKKSLVS